MKHKTILDIAKELNISPSTVSRALNNHPDINANTKVLVNQVAKSMGYVPNPIALGLRKNKTSTIGVIVPEIKHDFFASAISGIEEIAYCSGFTIIVCQSNESYEREVINTRALINHRVAGIIVSISQTTTNGEHFNELNKRGIPLVFFDRVCTDVKASKVIIDDKKSAYNAVHYLVQKGYYKIAHLGGPKDLDICSKRFQGYCKALEEGNLSINPNLILSGGLHEQDGYTMMDNLIKNNISVNAIFAINDPVAIGAFQRIKEAGLKIPQDIGIIGFSNNKITSLVEPQLTTVNQPSFNMGKRAAEIMVELINKENISFEPIIEILDAELIIRDST
jgi:DNA-binding LacI/PurR family transcriptional regulator